MNAVSRIIMVLLCGFSLISLAGCGKGKAVPSEEEAKSAIEAHITTFANLTPSLLGSPVRVAGIEAFELLETHDKGDFDDLSGKIDSKMDLEFLGQTEKLYEGDSAIVKASYALRFSGGKDVQETEPGGKTQWFLLRRPEKGAWQVAFPLSDATRD